MVELVDTRDLKSRDPCGRAGSTPAPGTIKSSREYPEKQVFTAFFILLFYPYGYLFMT